MLTPVGALIAVEPQSVRAYPCLALRTVSGTLPLRSARPDRFTRLQGLCQRDGDCRPLLCPLRSPCCKVAHRTLKGRSHARRVGLDRAQSRMMPVCASSGDELGLEGSVLRGGVLALRVLVVPVAPRVRVDMLSGGEPNLGDVPGVKVVGGAWAAHSCGNPARVNRVRDSVGPAVRHGDGEGGDVKLAVLVRGAAEVSID